MSVESPSFLTSNAQMRRNLKELDQNPYPGRGIVLGRSEDPNELVMGYWVMGRSEQSRNRLLAEKGATVKTIAFDEKLVKDPSLIIYNAMRMRSFSKETLHVVSNGDQTDTVFKTSPRRLAVRPLEVFNEAMYQREFEPDSPNFTPRIAGAIAIGLTNEYAYAIIRRNPTTGEAEHSFGGGGLSDLPAGAGICFHTYQGDGNPLPPFEGSPYAIPVASNADEIAEELWDNLNPENRVGLTVRTIDAISGHVKSTRIINQLG